MFGASVIFTTFFFAYEYFVSYRFISYIKLQKSIISYNTFYMIYIIYMLYNLYPTILRPTKTKSTQLIFHSFKLVRVSFVSFRARRSSGSSAWLIWFFLVGFSIKQKKLLALLRTRILMTPLTQNYKYIFNKILSHNLFEISWNPQVENNGAQKLLCGNVKKISIAKNSCAK